MELVREIALFFEEADVTWVEASHSGHRRLNNRIVSGMLPDIEGYSDEELRHAPAIMVDSRFLVEKTEFLGGSSGNPTVVVGRRLGWNGHEFLDAVRDDAAFNRVADAANRAKIWTFQFLLEAAKKYALQQVGLQPLDASHLRETAGVGRGA